MYWWASLGVLNILPTGYRLRHPGGFWQPLIFGSKGRRISLKEGFQSFLRVKQAL
jgi:hypothetical protein